MAVPTKLSLYNNALLLLGQRILSTDTDDVPPRYHLDAIYDQQAIAYCLEVSKPSFATRIAKSTTTTTHTATGWTNAVHDLSVLGAGATDDYVTVVGVFSDSSLDQEVNRYLIEGNTIISEEHPTLYIRYISSTYATTFTHWTPSFEKLVESYLAKSASIKIAPSLFEGLEALFTKRVQIVTELDTLTEPEKRASGKTVTLTNDWRKIYNDALLIMGLEEITANADDSNRRTKLDRALDASLVASLLEDTGWTFAVTSMESTYNPSLEPAWGYTRVHDYPSDLHRLDGVFVDEYMQVPLKDYEDEGDQFFCDQDVIYIKYISTDWLTNPSNWSAYFRRLVASRMAKDTAKSLRVEGADYENSVIEYEDRKSEAKSIDAMASPPRRLATGSWVRSRHRSNSRGRP